MNNSNIFYIMVAIAPLLVIIGLTTPAKCQEANLVDEVCLGCICEASTGCNLTKSCTTDTCGPFRITWFYWADSGQRTVNGEAVDSPTAFENCVLDPACAAQTVQNYMQTFQQDCNGDGKIDCYDYAAIHQLGGYGCPGRISGSYANNLNKCLSAYGGYETEIPEKLTTSTTPNSLSKADDIISEEPPQTIQAGQLQENVTKSTQITKSGDVVQNFDFEVSIPPLTVLELIRSNTTTASPLGSKLNENNNISTEFMVDRENTANSTKSGSENMSSIPAPDRFNGPQLKSPPKESRQDHFTNKLEQMEKTKNNYRAKQLSLQERFLKAFVDKNRIEEERNELLKGIAKNNKPSDGILLKRQAIEDSQARLVNILERIEKSQNDRREEELRFQQNFLAEFLKKNRIEEERNKILKDIAKNKKPLAIAPDYFLS